MIDMKKTTRRNSGAILVFVLVATATLTALALLAGMYASDRARIVSDTVTRSALRDEAFDALALAASLIASDTNGVDHLSEEWAQPMRFGRVEVFIADETSRLNFTSAPPAAFASLLSEPKAADALTAWRDSQNTNRVWMAEEELLLAPHTPNLRDALPFLTAHGDSRVNVNTLPHEVFVALAASRNIPAATADEIFKRLEDARKRGEFFAALTPAEAARIFSSSAKTPSPQELAALQTLLPSLRVESGLFRVTARASEGAVSQTIQIVYERATSRILRWVEL